MRKVFQITTTFCLIVVALISCGKEGQLRWRKENGEMVLTGGSRIIGVLTVTEAEGITHKETVKKLDPKTWRATCSFTAGTDIDSVRLDAGFTNLSGTTFWMIPSVTYNGNHWGKGQEPKGAKRDGQWWTYSYRRTPIPGIMYSEGNEYAVATWSEAPEDPENGFAVSLQPDEGQVRHIYIWPEEETPLVYSNTNQYRPGTRKKVSMKKGQTVRLDIFIHVTPVKAEHAAMRSFLDKTWDLAAKPEVEVYPPKKLWDLGICYAKESLWAEDGDYKGFSIGLLPTPDGTWKQRGGGKYEIGWCGQNASFAISLMEDYLRNGSKESLDKGIATLDTWTACALPNGLFRVSYDNPEGNIDACNLGTAAVNFFEAADKAAECGIERPEYERIAFAICDFVIADQQENGCYAKGWRPDGEAVYREGTIGCFLVPAMIEAFKRSGNEDYLSSAKKAYAHYISELNENGFTTAGALDTWCIDKESSIALLRSAMRFHRLGGDPEYLEDVVNISYYLSTWLWNYDEVYPMEEDATRYGFHTFGATSVSTQHHHLDPYALYWVPEWVELSKLTGDSRWLERARSIWRYGNQLVSDGELVVNGLVRPAGSQNEAFFECTWGLGAAGAYNEAGQRINNWLVAWPGAFRLETLRRLSDWSIL